MVFKILSLLILVHVFNGCAEDKADNRPNILFIMSDDHAYQALSAYTDRLITTNIDRISDEGVLFTNACVANSLRSFKSDNINRETQSY